MGHFLCQPNESSSRLERFAAQQAWQSVLTNHKKHGLWPWTQLSASPRTVHFRCMSVVDHVDQAAPRAPGRWTTARPRKGTTRSQGRLGSCFPCGGEYEGLLVRLPSPENNSRCGWVEGWLGQRWEYGGAVRPARQQSWPWGGGSRQSCRRLFERLEQEEQRLKNHNGRWMDIQPSLLVRQPLF